MKQIDDVHIALPLAEFKDGNYTGSFEASAEALGLHEGHEIARFGDPVSVTVEARRLTEGEILVRAAVAFEASQECVSCLEPVALKSDETLEMLFYPEAQRHEMEAHGDALDTVDIGFHDGLRIVLDDEIAGFILQQLPEYPRCADECAGLDLSGSAIAPGTAGESAAERRREKLEPEWKRQLRELSQQVGGADEAPPAEES